MTAYYQKYTPNCENLRKHISHYWIVNDSQNLLGIEKMYAYPGVTPEIFIPLEGYFESSYRGKTYQYDKPIAFGHLDEKILLSAAHLHSFIIVTFHSRSLSSILPFMNAEATEFMKNPICLLSELFKDWSDHILTDLKQADSQDKGVILDTFFAQKLKKDSNGFLLEMMEENEQIHDLKSIMNKTNYSYSTLERYFKRETGLTPKKYHSLCRYKKAVEEIYHTQSSDWMHFVQKYDYYDQSHFIKEIKRYTTFTPSQLLDTPGLISRRPF